MTPKTLASRSLSHYWRTNLAVITGVATAVAVLAGALLVGDSVRGSLRQLILSRIGKADFVIAAATPFRAALAADLAKQFPATNPMLVLEGIVAHGSSGRAASKVAIYGITDDFFAFHNVPPPSQLPSARNVLLSPALAADLAAQPGDPIVLRLPKPSDIPTESLHGRKEDSVKAARFTATAILPPSQLGEFALKPSQGAIRAVFVSLPRLQRELARPNDANVLLLSAPQASSAQIDAALQSTASLRDLGIKIKQLDDRRHLSLETSSMVINDALAAAVTTAAQKSNLTPKPVLTYLVNFLRNNEREVPYSLIAALDLSLLGAPPNASGLILNDWTARELAAKPTDTLQMDYYVWLTEGRLATESTRLPVLSVTPITGAANDRHYAPDYPGITEARTIHDWDPPFPMELNKIRKQDEDYWDNYRTTPKAFLSLEQGQKLWGTRYGKLTSIRLIPPPDTDLPTAAAAFEKALRPLLRPQDLGITAVPLRQQGLTASSGSTDFGQYFLYFSFFLVVSALLLVSLFFKLSVEQRSREAGLLRSIGFNIDQLARLFLTEGLGLAAIGALVGTIAAALYAALILYGLRTWWVDAVGTTLLQLHLSPVSLFAGFAGGLLTAAIVIYRATRALRHPSPRALLQGNISLTETSRQTRRARLLSILTLILGVTLLAASATSNIPPTAGFFGAGACLLISALAAQKIWLASGVTGVASLFQLGVRNATYRPGRSVLSVALIASASFLILALTAFRQEGASQDPEKRPGTARFALIGESVLPVIHNPNTPAGRQELGFSSDAEPLFKQVHIASLRLRPGDDSSCLNLYAPQNPRVLAVTDDVLFRLPLSKEKIAPRPGEIAAYVDANSLQYVLHKKVGDEIILQPDSQVPVRLRISATITDSIFQSEILIRESDFLKAFPEQQGFRVFLVEGPAAVLPQVITQMEDRLKDYGLDLQSTIQRLNEFHRVENAYLSTFQSLGALGLLLGTIGLAAVLLRNVFERRKELALLRAVGYAPQQLATLVLAENILLLASGLTIGAVTAALAIAPALLERGSHLPLPALAAMLAAVALTGLAASWFAVRAAIRSPLLASLRAE